MSIVLDSKFLTTLSRWHVHDSPEKKIAQWSDVRDAAVAGLSRAPSSISSKVNACGPNEMATLPDYLMKTYGPTLNMEQLARLLHTSKKTIENRVSGGLFPIATYREGRTRVASAESIAAYLECKQKEAEKTLADVQDAMNS